MNQDKIGSVIKNLRLKNNLTQKDLASILGVTYQAVSKWENGKNIPDIGVLKSISNKFNIDINSLLDGEEKVRKEHNKLFVIIPLIVTIIILAAILIAFIIKDDTSYEFKTLSTTCTSFKISGVAAYSKDKTSIYISNIDYCGGNDDVQYKNIKCYLYEKDDNVETIISKEESSDATTLSNYLKSITFKIDDYKTTCNIFKSKELYLRIDASNKDGEIITYQIPLTLEDDCFN